MVGKLLHSLLCISPFLEIMFSVYEADISFFHRFCQLVSKSSCSSSI